MITGSVAVDAGLRAFWRSELGITTDRARAFSRSLVAVLLSIATVTIFHLPDAIWTATFALLVSSPAVGQSVKNAAARIIITLIVAAIGIAFTISAVGQPWLFLPLQAVALGVAVFLTQASPLGLLAVNGGATFAVITAGATLDPGNAIDLAFYRLWQAVLGCLFGVFAQIVCWPDDPLQLLERSLARQLQDIEAFITGAAVKLDPGRIVRHFELLANAEVRHPAMVQRRPEITLLILELGVLTDEALRQRVVEGPTRALLLETCARMHRQRQALTSAPPLHLPPLPPPAWFPQVMSSALRPARRQALKAMLTALIVLIVLDVLQLPSRAALLGALFIGATISTGTALSKVVIPIAAFAGALIVILIVNCLTMPNVDDFGSFLLVAAVAVTPAVWLASAGPRVRTAGLLSALLICTGLLTEFRPSDQLEPTFVVALAQGIGCVVVAFVDRAVWPVSARRNMWHHMALMLRSTAHLLRMRDPLLMLAADRPPRWEIHHHLGAAIQLRGERTPQPGSARYEGEERVLHLASDTQRLIVHAVEQARAQLAGITPQWAPEEQAASLETHADRIDRAYP
jgi:uncharacterized membrane protein YccC